jgi:hypothetical protein
MIRIGPTFFACNLQTLESEDELMHERKVLVIMRVRTTNDTLSHFVYNVIISGLRLIRVNVFSFGIRSL